MDEARGTVKEVIFVIQDPDGTVRVGRLDPANVHSIILHNADAKAALGDPAWNTGMQSTNPTFAVKKTNGTYAGSCSVSSHPPIPAV